MGRADDIYSRIKEENLNAINEFFLNREAEALFLEFKCSSDDSGKVLSERDRHYLACAISGFGNSEGGVLIWGVHASKDNDHADVAKADCLINNVRRFQSWIENAISGCTVPPHVGVETYCVEKGQGNGYVITYAPKSIYAPHQVIVKGKHQDDYLIRSGSSFRKTPHSVLEGMFGKRPQPKLRHRFEGVSGGVEIIDTPTKVVLRVHVRLIIVNQGLGIASDIFIKTQCKSKVGENCNVSFKPVGGWKSHYNSSDIVSVSIMSDVEERIGPDFEVIAHEIILDFVPPYNNKLLIEGVYGCGQAGLNEFRLENEASVIHDLCLEYYNLYKQGELTEGKKQSLMKGILNI